MILDLKKLLKLSTKCSRDSCVGRVAEDFTLNTPSPSSNYNPGQNVLGHLRKLGTKTRFAKLTHILTHIRGLNLKSVKQCSIHKVERVYVWLTEENK